MVEFLINYKTSAFHPGTSDSAIAGALHSGGYKEDVTDQETFANIKDMTGEKYDFERGEMRAYTENIEEISVDGVSSEGEDYDAFNNWLDMKLGSFSPTIIRIMDDTPSREEVLEITGGDIPSPSASLVIKNLFPNEYQKWYQNWRQYTVERARDELSFIELESTGQTGFVDSIFDLFGL